ncbi:MAG: DegT/DnrJ/EryC1/StrS family aminotransferase [Candidatus Omnitrophica bacterium]|jgi:dTDP-4-amino-4,6-dideoxygalactose transaminase|nr:DegT/DnrJ/EryC1/StrS family aminotransferase [Candidatus Omnitrophota bacterium]
MKKLTIPLVDLKREYAFLKKGIGRQIKDCLASQHWILGEKVTQFEKELSKYLKSKYIIGLNSGTDAIILSLRAQAMKLKGKEYFDKEDEIITTPFTFIATAEAIIRSGATVVFVDIDPETFNINPQCIREAINKNTVGILPVHLFGLACDMENIVEIAKENDLFIVEDVAQAFGAGYVSEDRGQKIEDRKKLGTIGNCGAFSFFPSKNLGSYGDAGAISTDDRKVAELIVTLRNHGQTHQYDANYIGYNSRLDSIQAAILLAKLKYVDKFNNLRIKIAQKYHDGLKNIKNIYLPSAIPSTRPSARLRTSFGRCHMPSSTPQHVYNLYTIKVAANIRDGMLKFLNSAGIQARSYYPLPLHKMEAFKTAKISGNLINTEEASRGVLSLPVNPFLKNREIDYIIENIRVLAKK